MNNLRLLTGLLWAGLSGAALCTHAQTVMTPEEIFQIAESNAVQLKVANAAEAEAQKEIDVARTALLPDISADLQFSFIGDGFTTKRNFSDFQKAPIPHFGNTLSLNISQPVYTGGALTRNIELARLKSYSTRFTTELQRENLRFKLAGLYLDIYKYSNLRRVVLSNITSARKVLDMMQIKYEQGTALKNDITRYELLLSNLNLSLVQIDNTLKILNNDLVIMAGLPANTVIMPDTTLLLRSLPTHTEGWWQHEAATMSPSVRLATSGVDISKKAEELVKAERLPKIGLQAGWTLEGPILVEVPPVNRNLSYWWIGLGVRYNISSLFKTDKSIAKSHAATAKALEELELARQNISIAISTDYTRYLEAYERLKTLEKSVELSERNYRITSTRYDADMALITEMLDAFNARLEAEQLLVNAHIDIIYYYYKLLFTSGTL